MWIRTVEILTRGNCGQEENHKCSTYLKCDSPSLFADPDFQPVSWRLQNIWFYVDDSVNKSLLRGISANRAQP